MARRKQSRLIGFLAMALMSMGVGCHIANQVYRPGKDSVVMVSPPPQLPMPKGTAWPPHPEAQCDESRLLGRPCVAFLEFDEFGEAWQKNPSGRPAQLTNIRRLIDSARREDPQGQPLILTFIHGWKHNASEGKHSGDDDPNIIGVETVLNRLHNQEWAGHVVIGIYISWRGGLISPYWPVSQQFTYWNREATAFRVGNTSMTDALIEISDMAKGRPGCKGADGCHASAACVEASKTLGQDGNGRPTQPELDTAIRVCSARLIYVGHSFGALVLERALSQAMVTRLEREYNEVVAQSSASSGQRVGVAPLADLVIYVNSAAAATESKQMMDYLASSQFTYRPVNDRTDEPLFLSVTSEADTATGLLLKVGHAVPLLGYKMNGSMRDKSAGNPNGPTTSYARACFDSLKEDEGSKIKTDLSESDYFMSTTAHKQELWSHLVISTSVAGDAPEAPFCVHSPEGSDTYATCDIGQHKYRIVAAPDRCNGTPYWALQVEKEIIPDHGTIFTGRLIAFLLPFIPQPPAVNQGPGEGLMRAVQ